MDPATPLEPAQALRFFLDALGVPPHRIPADIEGRSALFRSMLDDRHMLIVLDNARNVGQVRPLLPGAPGSLVVVTSRNELTGLVAAEGAVPLTLDVLGDREAHEMLARRLGQARVAAEPGAADEIIAACARLPLALGIAAGRAAGRPKRPLTELAAELHDGARPAGRARRRRRGDQRAGRVLLVLRSALRARGGAMFRLLGRARRPGYRRCRPRPAWPGCRGPRQAPRCGAGQEPHGGRVPAGPVFVSRLAPRVRSRPGRTKSTRSPSAGPRCTGCCDQLPWRTADDGVQPVQPVPVPAAADRAAAGRGARRRDGQGSRRWPGSTPRSRCCLALIAYADANDFDTHAWQIPWTLGPFFNRRGRWQDYTSTQQTALAAATQLDDRLALAHAHHLLGHVQSQVGSYADADPNFRRALDLFRELGDRANEAVVLNGLAGMLEKQERYPEALAVALDALRMLKAVGHWWTQATLENGVGWLYAHLGQYDRALTHCQRALSLHRDSGHRGGTADTLDSIGYAELPAPGGHRPGQGELHQGDRGLPRDRRAVRRGQLAVRARRRPAGRGRPGGRPDGLARIRRDLGPAPAPARRRGPGQAQRPGPGGARSANRGSHGGPLGIKERYGGYGDEPVRRRDLGKV